MPVSTGYAMPATGRFCDQPVGVVVPIGSTRMLVDRDERFTFGGGNFADGGAIEVFGLGVEGCSIGETEEGDGE